RPARRSLPERPGAGAAALYREKMLNRSWIRAAAPVLPGSQPSTGHLEAPTPGISQGLPTRPDRATDPRLAVQWLAWGTPRPWPRTREPCCPPSARPGPEMDRHPLPLSGWNSLPGTREGA